MSPLSASELPAAVPAWDCSGTVEERLCGGAPLAVVAGADLGALGEISGVRVFVCLGEFVRHQQHLQTRRAAFDGRGGVEGDADNDETVQERGEEQHGEKAIPDGCLTFTQHE